MGTYSPVPVVHSE